VRSTVDRAFQGAFRTVLAADLVSLLAALTLYLLSVGDVRGFAFFLGIATLLDIFTTFFFTRPLVIWLGRSRKVTDARIIGIARGLGGSAEPAA
jgi:preprotein translocase subunit SecD